MIFKGFKFGMLLQLAVGPLCLLVFKAAASFGFLAALSAVCAIALVDALFIFFSGIGVSAVLNKPRVKAAVKIFGAAVLILFGLNIALSALGVALLPGISLFSDVSGKTLFVQGMLLTASNPLTIVFWSGVFSTQVAQHGYGKRQLVLFGIGCVLSTVIFLTAVALCGAFIGQFIGEAVLKALNVCVGTVVAILGVRLALKKE